MHVLFSLSRSRVVPVLRLGMMDLVMDALKALVPPEPTGMSVSIGLFMLFLGLLYW